MSDNLQIAKEELEAGRVRKALWRLEAARQEALAAQDLDALGDVIRLAAQGRAQAGPMLSARFEAVRYAAQQNHSELARREPGAVEPGSLSPEVREARIRDDLERGNFKAALQALWAEKTSAAVAEDAGRLRAVIALAGLIASRSEGKRRSEARLLASGAEAELSALERAGPRPAPTPPRSTAPVASAPVQAQVPLAARLQALERKLEALGADYSGRVEAIEDEIVQLWALAGVEPATEAAEAAEEQALVVLFEPEPVRPAT